jgi:hypothetical protein
LLVVYKTLCAQHRKAALARALSGQKQSIYGEFSGRGHRSKAVTAGMERRSLATSAKLKRESED